MERVNKRRRLTRRKQLEDVPELKRRRITRSQQLQAELKRRRLTRRQQLKDVPDLIQQIQSLLPADQAACTCVVSKSWLHALLATPDLRFQPVKSLNKQQDTQYMRLINRTPQRYHRDNLPIITCDIHFGINGKRSASSAEKWIKLVTSNTCLKELCLTVFPAGASYTLPDALFSSEKLDKLSLKLDEPKTYSLHISSKTVFNCVTLRALEFSISTDVPWHTTLSSQSCFARETGLASATEEGFLNLVRGTRDIEPLIAAVGSCCLPGLISEGTLCIANMGDSRAVLGCVKS